MKYSLKKTIDQFQTDCECAKKAGIHKYMFISFGSLLGWFRDGGMCPGDNDMDISFLAENITQKQQETYLTLLRTTGCFQHRHRIGKDAGGNVVWASIRKHPDSFKSCHWFWRPYKKFHYHTKGGVSKIKLTPTEYMKKLVPATFLGVETYVPERYGACLDYWYPRWWMPSGAQSGSTLLIEKGHLVKHPSLYYMAGI